LIDLPYLYLIFDTQKNQSIYKIGFADDPNKRLGQLNTSSSTCIKKYILDLILLIKFFRKYNSPSLKPFVLVIKKVKSNGFILVILN
jgi:hypothetical protein